VLNLTPSRPPDVKHPLVELVQARLREFWREPAILFWVFGFPLVMALGLGIAFRSRPPQLPEVAVVNPTGQPSAALARALVESPRLKARLLPLAEAKEELAHAKVDLLVELWPDRVVYHFDSMQERAPLSRLTTDDVVQAALGRKNPLPTEDRTDEKKGARYIDFLIPGLIAMNLMGSSLWGIGYNIVTQRKRRLLRRYAVTPMKRGHFMLSYVLSRLLFLAVEVFALVIMGVVLFDAVVQGSLVTLFLVSLLGGASFAGLGLLIAARIENTETASGWMNVIQLPMWVLSGPFFSYERFPDWTHPLLEALPLTALANALRAIYNEGQGILSLGPELLVLALWGVVPFLIALKTFRWQ
jgi:ABC-2 type transport system permease protein